MTARLRALAKSPAGKNALWLAGASVAHKLLSFGTGAVIARYLGPADYGLLQYGAAWVSFFQAAAALGLGPVLVRRLVRRPARQGQTLGTALWLRTAAALACLGGILVCTALWDADQPRRRAVTAICAVGLVFQTGEVLRCWFQARLAAKQAALAATAAYGASCLVRLALAWAGKGVVWLAAAAWVDQILLAALLWAAYRRRSGPPLLWHRRTARLLLASGGPYVLSGTMTALYGAADRLLLGQLATDTAVGWYGTAVTLAGVWTFLPAALIESAAPALYRQYGQTPKQFTAGLRRLYGAVFYGCCALALALSLTARPLVLLLYGESYLPAADLAAAAVWALPFAWLGVAREIWVECTGRRRALPGLYAAAAVLNLTLNGLLIPPLGAMGAALASILTQSLAALVLPGLFPPLRPGLRLVWQGLLLQKERSRP